LPGAALRHWSTKLCGQGEVATANQRNDTGRKCALFAEQLGMPTRMSQATTPRSE